MRRGLVVAVLVLTVCGLLPPAGLGTGLGHGIAGALPATAGVAQSRVVSENPVDWTPHVLDGTVWAITVVGDTVLVGGDFTEITDHTGQRTYERAYLFAYGLRDGAIRDFAPELDAPVYALAPGGSDTVFVGGVFTKIDGATHRGLARLRTATGAPVAGFSAGIDAGDVRQLAAAGRWLYAGGMFGAVNGVRRAALARLDAATGAVDAGFDVQLRAEGLPKTKVESLALSPDGRRLVAIGEFTHAAGRERTQLVMLDTASSPARVADWYTDAYQSDCDYRYDTYLRGVDFAPDGSYFVVVTTGRLSGAGRMCDTAARFDSDGDGDGEQEPVWVNHTGGDSLYTVAVTGSAVYVAGHQRWLDNPDGQDSAGPGAAYRPGIGAVDPDSGRALSWNPTRTRGVGVRALIATTQGLLVGSDTEELGHEYHARLGMFPLS